MQSSPWHVLHVYSNHEKRVAQHLAVRSVENYLPLYSERVKWTDRTVLVERPLFSGYVFVRFSAKSRLHVISIPGVLRVLGDEEKDTVSCQELDRIRDGLATGLPIRPHPYASIGTRVRVRDGIFAGVEGVVTEFRQQCKVIVTLSGARQSFSLELQLGDLDVLKQPVPAPRPGPVFTAGFNLQRARS
jgi:transcriptional antiterminator NusG